MPYRAASDRIDADAPKKTTKTARMVTTFQRRLDICLCLYGFEARLDDRRLALIAADGRFRHLDAHLVGDLQLHVLLVRGA